MRILVIDSYDSFTFNLVQRLGQLGASVEVVRNDEESPAALRARRPDGVVLSPGPGTPERSGSLLDALREFAAAQVPLLGVCLGHQAIGVAYGGRLAPAPELAHGVAAQIRHAGDGVLRGIPTPFEAAVYHSLVLEPASVPPELEITARGPRGEVMSLRHRELPLEGVQFHPESILTPQGPRLLENFLDRCGGGAS